MASSCSLGFAVDDTVSSTVHALWAARDDIFAVVERTGQAADQSMVALERLDRAGRVAGRDFAFPLDPVHGGDAGRPVARLSQGAGALVAGFDGERRIVKALDDAFAPLAAQLMEAGGGPVLELAVNAATVAALQATGRDGSGPQSIVVLTVDNGAPALPDLSALKLNDRRRVSALALTDAGLLVGVADPQSGFDIFRYDLSDLGAGPEPMITRGGHRFAVNAAVTGFSADGDDVLFGTAAFTSTLGLPGNSGPELGLIGPDGTWDLAFGQPRFSPGGLVLPASGKGPGLNRPQNAAIKAIARIDRPGVVGRVVVVIQDYVGYPGQTLAETPLAMHAYCGPARLLVSDDLVTWDEVALNLPPETGSISCLCAVGGNLVLGHEGIGAATTPVTILENMC